MSWPKLDNTKPLKLSVKYQNYGICSMLSPNSLPVEKRHYAENQNVYGFKLYGVCETEKQKEEFCLKLQKQNKYHNVCPFNIGEVMEFDVDTSKNNPETKIIYREEELNKTIGDKTFNSSIHEKENIEEKTIEHEEIVLEETEEVEREENEENKRECGFVHTAKTQEWVCVQFYPASAYEKTKPEVIQGRKIVSFKVHGVFDSFDKARKYRSKYPKQLIFEGQVGRWIAFNSNLLENLKLGAMEENLTSLNNFMEIYEKALHDETLDEEKRKKESLEGAKIVSGEFDVMGTSKKETEERELKNNHVETEEEQLEREIKELKQQEEKLKRVVCSKEEFEQKCDEILELHKMLVSEK